MAEQAEQLEQYIQERMGDFERYTQLNLKRKLQEQGIELTGDTLRSLRTEVRKNSRDMAFAMLLSFQESGRIQEMKRLNWTKLPPAELIDGEVRFLQLEDYVRRRGVERFAYVPGYKPRTIPTESIAVKRIAWGIAMHIRNGREFKPRAWFNRPFYSSMNRLIDGLITDTQKVTGKVVSAGFELN